MLVLGATVFMTLGCGGDREPRSGAIDGSIAPRDAPAADGRALDAPAIDGAVADGGTDPAPALLTQCWRTMATGGDGEVLAIASEGGSLFGAGWFKERFDIGGIAVDTASSQAGVLFALDAATGAPQWVERFESETYSQVGAVDAIGGDVLIALTSDTPVQVRTAMLPAGAVLARLRAATREIVWTRSFETTSPIDVSFGKIAPNGYFVVAGRFDDQLTIETGRVLDAGSGTAGPDGFAAAVDAATGAPVWATSFGERGGFDGVAHAAFADGDLILTGESRSDASIDSRLYLQRLDGDTGAVVWRQRFVPAWGSGSAEVLGTAIAPVPEGLLVAGPLMSDGADVGTGPLSRVASEDSAFVALYDPATGEAIRANVVRARHRYGLRAPLPVAGSTVTLIDDDAYDSFDATTLARTAIWELPLSVGEEVVGLASLSVGSRIFFAGRDNVVLHTLDPLVICLERP